MILVEVVADWSSAAARMLCLLFMGVIGACDLYYEDGKDDPYCPAADSPVHADVDEWMELDLGFYMFYPTNFSWQPHPVEPRFSLNESSFGDGCAEGISSDRMPDLHSAIQTGAYVWAFERAPVSILHLPTDVTTAGRAEGDGINAVTCEPGYATEDDRTTPDYEVIARADMWYDKTRPECGATDCDITLYGKWWQCTARDEGGECLDWSLMTIPYAILPTDMGYWVDPSSDLRIETRGVFWVMAHEFGHCLGLSHNNTAGSVMDHGSYSTWAGGAVLPIDEAVINFLY